MKSTPHRYDPMIVENTCMQLVNRPTQFDIMVMNNLYGNQIMKIIRPFLNKERQFQENILRIHRELFLLQQM